MSIITAQNNIALMIIHWREYLYIHYKNESVGTCTFIYCLKSIWDPELYPYTLAHIGYNI